MLNKLLTKIPFHGFYNSIHNYNLQQTLESYLNDEIATSEKISKFCELHNFSKKCFIEYSKIYTSKLSSELGFDLKFESLESPKEYNFVTDRIFAYISLESVLKLRESVNSDLFTDYIKECFTSRSGFISHYNSDLRKWGSLKDWDHNQIGSLLSFYCNQELDDDRELYSMDDASGNGELCELISNDLNDEQRVIENAICDRTES
jgi:hypothetical protein